MDFLFEHRPKTMGYSPFALSVMASAYAHLTGPPANKNHKILQAMSGVDARTHLVKLHTHARRVLLHIEYSKGPTTDSEISE
jgi:hypothetical protein